MHDRRLVAIDLGITSVYTVRVLAGDGTIVCRRKAVPAIASLVEVERAALTGATPGTCLEVVLDPTGPPGCRSRCSSVPAAMAAFAARSGPPIDTLDDPEHGNQQPPGKLAP